jgi:hypothetical protein
MLGIRGRDGVQHARHAGGAVASDVGAGALAGTDRQIETEPIAIEPSPAHRQGRMPRRSVKIAGLMLLP